MAYDSAIAKSKENLDRLKGQALRIYCGLLSGTALASLQMECGKLAISLRLRQSDYTVKIRSDRSPDGKHHERPLAEHLRHVLVGQGTVLADVPQVPLETAPCIQQPAVTNLMTSHWQTAWDNEETGALHRHLQPYVGYRSSTACNLDGRKQ